MDFPLFTLLIACLGFFFGFFPLESQQNVNPPPPKVLHPPPHPPPPPPPPLPPTPPTLSPPPFVTLPPPQTPPPFLPVPSPPSESQWLPQPFPRPPIPPKKRLRPPPPNDAISKHRDHNHQSSLKNLTRTKTKNLNEGKKIGLIFVGVVAILQVCVAAFLLIRRRQIL